MKHIKKCKPSRLEIRFNNVLRNLKRYTEDDWKKYGETAEKKGKEKIQAEWKGIYYGHPENRFKDLKYRKNWRKKHPGLIARGTW